MSFPDERLSLTLLLADPRLSADDRELAARSWHRVVKVVGAYGRLHLVLHEPRCQVCRSPMRIEIEQAVRANTLRYGLGSTRGIVGLLPPEGRVSWRSIKRHVDRGHDPLWSILRAEQASHSLAALRTTLGPALASLLDPDDVAVDAAEEPPGPE